MKNILIIFICMLLLCSCGYNKVEECKDIESGEYYIHFHTDGGTEMESIKIEPNSVDYKNIKIENPVKEGYRFEAWYYDRDFLMRFDGEDTNSLELKYTRDEIGCENGYRDIDLYALWVQ